MQPVAILQTRTVLRGNKQIQQHLLQWEGLLELQATWEDHFTMAEAFLHFNLGDKVDYNGVVLS